MTLSFSTQLNGKPTYFVEKIWRSLEVFQLVSFDEFSDMDDSTPSEVFNLDHYDQLGGDEWNGKIHTIRKDKKDRWKAGNDIHFVINNRTKNRFQFAPVLKVKSVQKIDIIYRYARVIILFDGKFYCDSDNKEKMEILAINDGFDSVDDFFKYFDKDFTGKIIHWTNIKY